MKTSIAFLFVSFFLFSNIYAQQKKDLEFGLSLGAALYSGDLSSGEVSDYLEDLRPAIGAFGKMNFNSWSAGKLSLTLSQLTGDDDPGSRNENRNLNFRSHLVELSATFEIHPFSFGRKEMRKFSPYLYGGVAAFHFNPKTDIDGTRHNLQPLGTEGQGIAGNEGKYNRVQAALIFGGGLRLRLKNGWAIFGEIAPRFTFTDHLDDVSSTLVDYNQLISNNGSTAAAASNRDPKFDPSDATSIIYQRGGDARDFYLIGTIGISKKFGSSIHSKGTGCPGF